MTIHDRWQAFKGKSTEASDLVFTLKKSSILQFKTKLDVFLATNTKQDVCDFRVKGSWLDRSCIVYAGESDTIVAQVINYISSSLILEEIYYFIAEFIPSQLINY